MDLNDFSKIPSLVAYIKCSTFVSGDDLNEAIDKYPEWFPEEVEYRRQMDLVPEWVKGFVFNEWIRISDEIRSEVFKDFGDKDFNGCGIVYMMTHHEDELEEIQKLNYIVNKKTKGLMQKLEKKYYSKWINKKGH